MVLARIPSLATYYSSVAGDSSQKITDPSVIRALAHPARLAILEYLGSTGAEITATEAAEVVGLSPSATSYHLRALAKAGIIHDAPSRGDGRERVYRGPSETRIEVDTEPGDDPELKALKDQLLDLLLARSQERLSHWRDHYAEQPERWREASVINETMITVTPEELTELTEQIAQLVGRYRRSRRKGAEPEGARLVSMLVRALPQ
jgi:DNA-binding transcriptional ArsR family regulator